MHPVPDDFYNNFVQWIEVIGKIISVAVVVLTPIVGGIAGLVSNWRLNNHKRQSAATIKDLLEKHGENQSTIASLQSQILDVAKNAVPASAVASALNTATRSVPISETLERYAPALAALAPVGPAEDINKTIVMRPTTTVSVSPVSDQSSTAVAALPQAEPANVGAEVYTEEVAQ